MRNDTLVERLEGWQRHIAAMDDEHLLFYRDVGGPRIALEAAERIKELERRLRSWESAAHKDGYPCRQSDCLMAICKMARDAVLLEGREPKPQWWCKIHGGWIDAGSPCMYGCSQPSTTDIPALSIVPVERDEKSVGFGLALVKAEGYCNIRRGKVPE